jgi:hypothetical protein
VGYDEGDAEDRVFIAVTPSEPEPVEQHVAAGGITSVGMREFIDRLLFGFDPRWLDIGALAGVKHLDSQHLAIPVQARPVAACVELATFLVSFSL